MNEITIKQVNSNEISVLNDFFNKLFKTDKDIVSFYKNIKLSSDNSKDNAELRFDEILHGNLIVGYFFSYVYDDGEKITREFYAPEISPTYRWLYKDALEKFIDEYQFNERIDFCVANGVENPLGAKFVTLCEERGFEYDKPSSEERSKKAEVPFIVCKRI